MEQPALPADWCAYHNQSEPVEDGDIVCGECWHTFKGPHDLENVLFAQFGEVLPAAEIYSCPYCVHDF